MTQVGDLTRRTASISEILEEKPDFFEMICRHVGSGGSLVDVAEAFNIPYGALSYWIHQDRERHERYEGALNDHIMWCKETVLRELKRIATFDIREVFTEDGDIKDPKDWPSGLGHIIKEYQVTDVASKGEVVGERKSLKFWDKTKALESLMKNLGLLQPDIHVDLTLAELLTKVNEKEPPEEFRGKE